MEKLAIMGGEPVRKSPIHYGHQYIDETDIQAVVTVLRSDFLTCGPQVKELEKKLCQLTGASYAVAVSNGTAALHAACYAAEIGNGDEIITTPMTFAASANCALYCGAAPVFADIEKLCYNIDPAEIKKNVTNKTKAVIAVDFTGQAAQLDEIKEICREKNLVLIEDAAHSIGTLYKGKPVGQIADLTTFSFHPVKTVTSGEGGAILTNNKQYYERLLLFRAHGITREPEQMKKKPEGEWYYEQIGLGYNYRITDIQAALLCSQLDKLGKFKMRRKEIVQMYDHAFEKLPEIVIQQEIKASDTARHLYLIQLNLELLKANRKEIFDALTAENIFGNVHYIPVYYFPYYQDLGYQKGICPNAEWLYERIISIPLYYGMTDQDADDVIRGVEKVVNFYRI